MARLAVAGVALALVLAPEIAMAQSESAIGAPAMPAMSPMARPMPVMPAMPAMSGPDGDRWVSVPGGWNAYRAPGYGYTLPRHWVSSTYYIPDYRSFGLPSPAAGYGWSRYYDDMVLTDRWGRVYDWRDARDAHDGREGGDYRPRKRDRSGIVGTIIGGAVGALTGNLIAGAGSRLAGSLIGGGVGALAGQVIDSGKIGGRDGYRGGDSHGYGYRAQGPHWFMGDYDGGYHASCNCGQTVTTTTTYAQPITTRKVTYVTEYVRVPARRHVVRTKDVRLGKDVRLD